jgi:hypothetical protein
MRRGMWVSVAIAAALVSPLGARAGTVTWKGLTWTTYGAHTTATVNGAGGLDITVLGGESGDPEPDNWVLKGPLPSNLTQANAPWVRFMVTDTYAGDAGVGGPRGFVDTDVNNPLVVETMWQGGVIAGYSHYYLNHNVYDANNGGWANDPNNWYTGGSRGAGQHVVLIGMHTDGTVDMWFDGVLGQTISPSLDCTFFERMWLGVDTSTGTTFTGTYNDFQYGTGYVAPVTPVPTLATWGLLLLAALIGLAALFWLLKVPGM